MSKNKAIWLARLLHRRGRMNKESILGAWAEVSEDGEPMRRSTFYDNRRFLQERYGIEIACEGGYYYIDSRWGDAAFCEHLLAEPIADAHPYVLPQPEARGSEHLHALLAALDDSRELSMHYAPYDKQGYYTLLSPYCIRHFRGRSYVVGHSSRHDAVRTFAFDRILLLEPTGSSFRRPSSFSAREYFRHSFGVYGGDDFTPVDVEIEVSPRAAAYLTSMPLHSSQHELPGTEDKQRFGLHICPTRDFVGELLTYGAELRVIRPESLREEIRGILAEMSKNY